MPIQRRFAGYPSAFAYAEPTRVPEGKRNAGDPDGEVVADLLWGQYVGLYTGNDAESIDGFEKVRIRGKRDCWMESGTFQRERLLEVIFVDIGQGDGCLVVTPDDRFVMIDAGQHDNMYRFLRWRFNFAGQEEPVPIIGIVSHPDSDHYAGFSDFFEDENVFFEAIYHNGIIEQRGSDPLGPTKKVGRRKYLTGVARTREQLEDFLDGDSWRHPSGSQWDKQYPAMLERARSLGRYDDIQALDVHTNGGFVPGFEEDQPVSMRILGPVPEDVDEDEPGLRWLGSKGKTKNGHSVVVRLTFGDVSVLLGGDLNIESEELLLEHHTGQRIPKESKEAEYAAFLEQARKVFQVDVAKSCHHGSADFLRTYLAATLPTVTVISSGDDESHAHPRADALGTVGRYQRGVRSLIFNTELARSSGEVLEIPLVVRKELDALAVALELTRRRLADDEGILTEEAREELEEEIASLEQRRDRTWTRLARSVDVYGAINLRTDGKRIVMAQKLERKRGSTEWDIYRLEKPEDDPDADFQYVSKYEG